MGVVYPTGSIITGIPFTIKEQEVWKEGQGRDKNYVHHDQQVSKFICRCPVRRCVHHESLEGDDPPPQMVASTAVQCQCVLLCHQRYKCLGVSNQRELYCSNEDTG